MFALIKKKHTQSQSEDSNEQNNICKQLKTEYDKAILNKIIFLINIFRTSEIPPNISSEQNTLRVFFQINHTFPEVDHGIYFWMGKEICANTVSKNSCKAKTIKNSKLIQSVNNTDSRIPFPGLTLKMVVTLRCIV